MDQPTNGPSDDILVMFRQVQATLEAAVSMNTRLQTVLRELCRQINIGTFVDDHGHDAHMLKAFQDGQKLLGEIEIRNSVRCSIPDRVSTT